MGPEFLNGVPFAFEFLLGEKGMDLLVAGRAEADGLVGLFARNIAFVAAIMVPATGNEVMTSQYLLAFAQTAPALHGLEYLPARSDVQ
ncbi:hypothetical protein TSACC_21623 [Terrimicrobium sacchariphilum]|uniref:Uncharacterized protein n=1 Tax=Terrimicrobium sacchariphilum TaxID=690879 RepID=A0A146G779_TERSA|nr:hypothetical protein TSACC_21623 [Terrimicrobium sacchariphilum]